MHKLKIPQQWLNKKLKIALIGCGGTGSEMFDELFRIHSLLIALGGDGFVLTAFDPKTVTHANIGRQRFWPCDVGFNKAEVLVSRVNNFGNTTWSFQNEDFDIEQVEEFNLIITCVDSPDVRAALGKKASKLNQVKKSVHSRSIPSPTFWLDCGNDASQGNTILGHFLLGDAPLRIPNVYDLYPVLDSMDVKDEPSCSTLAALEKQDYGINRSVAREAANLLWQFLRHGSLTHHGSYIDIKAGTVTPLMIDEKIWKSFRECA